MHVRQGDHLLFERAFIKSRALHTEALGSLLLVLGRNSLVNCALDRMLNVSQKSIITLLTPSAISGGMIYMYIVGFYRCEYRASDPCIFGTGASLTMIVGGLKVTVV